MYDVLDDIGRDEYENFVSQVPFLKTWPTDYVREHLVTALRRQADAMEKGEIPIHRAADAEPAGQRMGV